MRYVTLGNTNIEVSRLCFGTLTLGPLQARMAIEDGARVIARAIGHGVNFCDTAQLYRTYPYIKRAMEMTGRYDLVIASKTYAHTRKLAESAVDEARLALNRDYIDIFLLHEQESALTLSGHAEALEYIYGQKQRGVIKAVGASMHHVAAVLGAAEKSLDIAHPLINIEGLGILGGTRLDMERAIKKAHDAGTGIYAMKALGGGNLFKRAEQCLNYILGLCGIDSIAIGMQSAEEVEANIKFFETGGFDEAAKKKLDQKTRRLLVDEWCGGCGECVSKCGQRALTLDGGRAVCDDGKCVLCGYCSGVCPNWSIRII